MSRELYASFMKILLCVFFALRVGCACRVVYLFSFLVVGDLFLICFVFLLRFCQFDGCL